MDTNLLADESAGILTLTMNRPEKRNPLSSAMMADLIAALRGAGDNSEVRVVVLRGAGPAFCAGHDLSEMTGRDLGFYRELFDRCCRLMETVQAIAQPVIAQVHGIATAAGCQLAATCDLVIAAESAKFATPGVRIGLFCSTPMVALSRAIGSKRAMEMLLGGQPIDAHTAESWGLVNHVTPDESLAEVTLAMARRIAEASPLTVAIGKQAFYRQIDMAQGEAYAYTKEVMSQNAIALDAQEGISAFLGKRQPRWCGR